MSNKMFLGDVPEITDLANDHEIIIYDGTDIKKIKRSNLFGDLAKPTNAKQIQNIVRGGYAAKTFDIADQFFCNKGSTEIAWDVIGHDIDTPANAKLTHATTLQCHDIIATLQFDATEAMYYCEEGLAAGTYHFTLLSGYDVAYGGGKTLQFALTKPVPVGGQIVFPWAYQQQSTNTKISTYESASSATAIETVAVTEGSDGTALGTADGTVDNMNHTHRLRYGSNNFTESAILQYLNSDKQSGYWKPQTKFDRPPSWVNSTAGFMYDLDPEFLSMIGDVKKITARNRITDGGGTDTVTCKFFLLARSEVYMGNEVNGINEGEPYPYYSDLSDLASAGISADKNRIKYRNGSPYYWWLRSPYASDGYYVRHVTLDGSLYTHTAYSSLGVAPACCII